MLPVRRERRKGSEIIGFAVSDDGDVKPFVAISGYLG
jgi:hypothetical protein